MKNSFSVCFALVCLFRFDSFFCRFVLFVLTDSIETHYSSFHNKLYLHLRRDEPVAPTKPPWKAFIEIKSYIDKSIWEMFFENLNIVHIQYPVVDDIRIIAGDLVIEFATLKDLDRANGIRLQGCFCVELLIQYAKK